MVRVADPGSTATVLTPSTLLAIPRIVSAVIVHSRQSGTVSMADLSAPGPVPVVAQAARNSRIVMTENSAVLLFPMGTFLILVDFQKILIFKLVLSGGVVQMGRSIPMGRYPWG